MVESIPKYHRYSNNNGYFHDNDDNDDEDDDDEIVQMQPSMFEIFRIDPTPPPDANIEDKFTTSATTEGEEEGSTTIDHEFYTTSTTTDEASDIAISDSSVLTTNTTNTNTNIKTPSLQNTTSNNYYDNIDNEILRTEYEGTIVFEDNSLAPTTVRTDIPNNIIIEDLSNCKNFDTVIGLLKQWITFGECYQRILLMMIQERLFGILMEVLSSQDEVVDDGAGVCDSLFELFNDFNKHQQQQLDTTTANTPPITIPPTTTILPNTKKTHPQPKDRQVPVILNNNTNKKKKKAKERDSTKNKNRNPTKNKNDPRDKTTDC